MRVLILDIENQFLDLALRMAAYGHDVFLYRHVDKGKVPRYGEGFRGIKFIDSWREYMPKCKDGLIMCSGNYVFMQELDRYREHGYRIFGPTAKSAELEIKRSKGMEAMKSLGFDLPPYHCFDSLEEAEAFARKSDQSYVFKNSGDEDNKDMTYVSSSPAEMVNWLRDKIARGIKLKSPCMLQEKIDLLCDYGVSGWFGPDGFLPDKFQTCWEHKRLMDGEIGPQTGEQGTVTAYSRDDKLAKEMLLPMAPILQALGHRGDFAIGVALDTKGKAWPLEFTARFGFPSTHIQTASHKGDPAQWMYDLLYGKDSLKVSYDVAIGVVLAQPMYPYGKSPPELVEGNPITGIDDAWDDIHLCSVMLGKGAVMDGGKIKEGPLYKTTGEYVMVATGLGKTITKARDKVYATVKEIKFPSAMYRTDIGKKLEDKLPALHKAGYALGVEY